MAKAIVVDVDDRPIGLLDRADVKYDDIYRVSALWLTDTKTGDCLITQRKWTKRNDPGKWMAAVSGTNEDSESYDQNIVHEIEEEIGLKDLNLRPGPKEFVDDGTHKFFCQWYFAEVDKDAVTIIIQEDQVEAFAWTSPQQLLKDVASESGKFAPSMRHTLDVLGVTLNSAARGLKQD